MLDLNVMKSSHNNKFKSKTSSGQNFSEKSSSLWTDFQDLILTFLAQ